jgi:hypothetical protein
MRANVLREREREIIDSVYAGKCVERERKKHAYARMRLCLCASVLREREREREREIIDSTQHMQNCVSIDKIDR